MENLQDGSSNKQAPDNNVQQEANIYEDEINLIDYCIVLWKWKWLILVSSILPTLVVGLTLFYSPRDYKVTYVYDLRSDLRSDLRNDLRNDLRSDLRNDLRSDLRDDISNWNLTEKNYHVLISRFYSEENLTKITNKLRENSLNEYAVLLGSGNSPEALGGLLKIEPVPSYIDLSKINLAEAGQLDSLRNLKAQLLKMTITGKPKEDLPKISSVIRDNFENIMHVYTVKDQLNAAARGLRAKIAAIEENRADLELVLKTNKAVLAKLKNIKTKTSDKRESNIALQFDISGKTEYLPIEYQIQAAESKTIQLEEQIVADEETYNRYKDLLALNKKLLAELKNKMSSYYTSQQFQSFLTALVNSYESKALKDYLNSYIKRIENRISASVPVSENPKISSIAKGTVKKIAIVFAIALMLSMFAAFLLEGLKKSQAQLS